MALRASIFRASAVSISSRGLNADEVPVFRFKILKLMNENQLASSIMYNDDYSLEHKYTAHVRDRRFNEDGQM